MKVAARNRELKIVRDVEVNRDAFNAPVTKPTVIATVWAAKGTLSGREFLAGAQTTAEERATFTIMYRPDLRTTDHLECDGRSYGIDGMRELGFRRELEIQATARS